MGFGTRFHALQSKKEVCSMKKFLAVLLTLAMVFSLNGFAFAESSAEKTAMTPGTFEGSANCQNGKVVL